MVDRSTFGLLRKLAPGTHNITNYFICVNPGKLKYCAVKCKQVPITTDPTHFFTQLDILRSEDDGGTWTSIFKVGGAKITLPIGNFTLITNDFNPTQVNMSPGNIFDVDGVTLLDRGDPAYIPPNILRVDCLSIADTDPGSGIEIVLPWDAPGGGANFVF